MHDKTKTLSRNFRLLYVLGFFSGSNFTLPIYILFGRDFLGLSYFQAGSFSLVSWFTTIGLDFLGGNVADKVGRKQAYVYGMAIQTLALVPFLITKSYPLLLISSGVSGIGTALSSNSIDAQVYEQASELGAKKDYQHANATRQMFVFAGRIYASVLGGMTYRIDPRLPYALYIIALLLALWAGARIQLKKKINEAEQPKYTVLMRTAFKVYRDNLGLVKFVIIGGLLALWSDMLFGYYQPLFIQQHISSTTLGVLFSAISIGSAFGSYLMRKLPDKLSPHAIQFVELAGVATTSLLLTFLKVPPALAAPLLMSVISGFMYPNMRLYINNHSPDGARTSVLSLATTIFNIGTGIGMVFAFYLADTIRPVTVLWIITAGALATLALSYWMPDSPSARDAANHDGYTDPMGLK